MNKFLYLLGIVFLSLLFNACSVPKMIAGEYYLQNRDYKGGLEHFKAEISQNTKDSSANYYYARFLLSQNKIKESLIYFKKAISLNPRMIYIIPGQGLPTEALRSWKKRDLHI